MRLPLEALTAMDEPSTYVPFHIRNSIINHIEKGIPPGGFVSAVISNDLKGAVGKADDINIKHLPSIVRWFYNHAPASVWREAV